MSTEAQETGRAAPPRIPRGERQTLLAVAARSIRSGLDHGAPLSPDPADYPQPLRELRASFVTLTRGGALRGCIGHLEAIQPLVVDVAENAYAAAFRDGRFPPLAAGELEGLNVHISVLTPPVPLPCDSEADLVARLRPGVDGLILEEGRRRGTFLPSVWESLADPAAFVRHLKVKAGLSPAHWSPDIRVYRYETESFGDGTA